jgi:FkbM family methyltransferase
MSEPKVVTAGGWEIFPVVLSDADGEAWLSVGSADTAPDTHLAAEDEPLAVPVRTARSDSVVAVGQEAPAVIKIDVEGFDGGD